LDRLALGARAEPAVVERKLQLGVDAAVGRDAGGAKQLVDVAARLVGHVAPGLARAIGEDQDVLAHLRLPLARPPAFASASRGDRAGGQTAQGRPSCKMPGVSIHKVALRNTSDHALKLHMSPM